MVAKKEFVLGSNPMLSGESYFSLKTDAVLYNFNLRFKYKDLNKKQVMINKQVDLKSALSLSTWELKADHFVAGT